jgi:hypothetical protein
MFNNLKLSWVIIPMFVSCRVPAFCTGETSGGVPIGGGPEIEPLSIRVQCYSSLKFPGEGGEPDVTFYAHELVWVTQQIMQEISTSTEDDPDKPKYETYEDQIEAEFSSMKEQWYEAAALHSGVEKGRLITYLQCFYEDGPNHILLRRGSIEDYSKIINQIKRSSIKRQFIASEFDDHILPMQVVPRSTPSGWLATARYMAGKPEPVGGWWFRAGGRLIRVRNSPKEREHYYVSDHGAKSDVVHDTKANFLTFDDSKRDALYAFNFWRWYSSKITAEEREIFQKRAILQMHQTEKHAYEVCWDLYPSEGAGFHRPMKYKDSDPWVHALSSQEEVLWAALSHDDQQVYHESYMHAIECFRFRGDIQVPVFIGDMFGRSEGRVGLSPFFTQIDQIFHPEDANRFKTFYILKELKKRVTSGLQKYLFRPLHSFGSPDRGSSYNDFAKELSRFRGTRKDFPVSDAILIQEMRLILKGNPLSDLELYFIPNLAVAWFLSEVARNETSMPVGLMLLDLIEGGDHFCDREGNDMYDLKHVLVHPRKPVDSRQRVPITDCYGSNIDLAEWDGMHPMAHAGSRKGGDIKLGNKQTLSTVRQKEGHLIIDWLHRVCRGDLNSERLLGEHVTPDYDEVKQLFSAKDKPSKKIEKIPVLLRKWQILKKIKQLFRNRLGSFDFLPCLVGSEDGVECPPVSGSGTGFKTPFGGAGIDFPPSTSSSPLGGPLSSAVPPSLEFSDHDEGPDFERVKMDSLKSAEDEKIIGPKYIEGWEIKDVEDKGNCFYDAVGHQMQLQSVEIEIPDGTMIRDILRLRVQGKSFKDCEWAEDETIDEFLKQFPQCVLVFVDTRMPELGFNNCRFVSEEGEVITITNADYFPAGKKILRLAATGNHFMSVVGHPLLSAGVLKEAHPAH